MSLELHVECCRLEWHTMSGSTDEMVAKVTDSGLPKCPEFLVVSPSDFAARFVVETEFGSGPPACDFSHLEERSAKEAEQLSEMVLQKPQSLHPLTFWSVAVAWQSGNKQLLLTMILEPVPKSHPLLQPRQVLVVNWIPGGRRKIEGLGPRVFQQG